MLSLQQQTKIIEGIAQILHDEAGSDYQTVSCEFEPFGEVDGGTMITKLEVSRGNRIENNGISARNLFDIVDLAIALRQNMASHTNGRWTSFRMKLAEAGQADIKFKYN